MADAPLAVYSRNETALMRPAELNAPVGFFEAIELAGAQHSEAIVMNPYEVLKDKTELIDVAFFVRSVRFVPGELSDTGNPYAILHIVDEKDRLWLVTDGSTGMFAQLGQLVADRIAAGDPKPHEGFLFANGLRVSEYPIDKNGAPIPKGDTTTKQGGVGRTFYFA